MFPSHDPQFGLGQHIAHKGITRVRLGRQLLRCPHHRIDFAPQLGVQRVQRLHHGHEVRRAHQQQIHIAVLSLRAARHRAVHEGQLDLRRQGRQRRAQRRHEAMRLAQQRRQIAEQRVLHVGAVARLVALVAAQQQAGGGQLVHLARQRAGIAARKARQLAQVQAARRLQQQGRQHLLPVGRKQQVHRRLCVAHKATIVAFRAATDKWGPPGSCRLRSGFRAKTALGRRRICASSYQIRSILLICQTAHVDLAGDGGGDEGGAAFL